MGKFLKYDNIVYVLSVLVGAWYVFVSRDAQNAFFASRVLANLATAFLYLSLLPSALNASFASYPGRVWLVKNRKSHGIVSFTLAACHGFVGFFSIVGGVVGLNESDSSYMIAVISGMFAFDILVLLALTSFATMMRKMGIWWKRLHRFVYLSGSLVLVHIALIRIYYFSIGDPISIISMLLFIVLFVLQAIRIQKYIYRKKYSVR